MPSTHERLITTLSSYFMTQYTKHYLNVTPTQTSTLPPPQSHKRYLLYIHVPFCLMFCPYCSFNKFAYTKELSKRYFKRLREELLHVKGLGYDFHQLVIGGGTPLIDPEELIATITLARKSFHITSVSCESDPNHIDPHTIHTLKGLVDRLSIGVQSFDDAILKKIGRYEKFGSGESIAGRIEAMLGILPITSVDLIFNFPSQSEKSLLKDLDRLIALSPEQSSIYPLMTSAMVKKGVRNSLGEFSMRHEALYYKRIQERLSLAYPVRHGWSYAKAQEELIDEYIIDNEEYVGIGSGAFSFLNDTLYVNAFDLDAYDTLIAQKRSALIKERRFPKTSQMYYRMMVDLFNGSLPKKRFEALFGVQIEEALSTELFILKQIHAIKEYPNRLETTEFGSYLFMVMMKEFYMGMDHIRARERQKINPSWLAQAS